ncbi:MAG TPA: SRPBCC family protein [Saprospiraceae bacterium]|nr:SRPBCC family protein [Saprospiraceae bacterium]HRK80301.1 SRPBCC family protein [Saprospiraceae bacterium]
MNIVNSVPVSDKKNTYHFITRWVVNATSAEVYRTLEAVEDLARWWPSVYLDVKQLEKGQPGGVGKLVALYTKGFLPYTLQWKFRVTQTQFPIGFSLEAIGDFAGTGEWTFRDMNEEQCEVIYDWRIRAEKPLLKKLTWLLRPLFSANHQWAMRKGEESLKLELRRRKAASDAERAAVPSPPGPVFPHNVTNNKVL